jgi:hypothetical protein
MTDANLDIAEFLRGQARKLRTLASQNHQPKTARLLELAAEFEVKAVEIERRGGGR